MNYSEVALLSVEILMVLCAFLCGVCLAWAGDLFYAESLKQENNKMRSLLSAANTRYTTSAQVAPAGRKSIKCTTKEESVKVTSVEAGAAGTAENTAIHYKKI